ncbi:MAG: SMC family ATPase [Ruminococcaceae bacterium]|nr:SMC family ATPase [Oscillospiraceae bacterium]
MRPVSLRFRCFGPYMGEQVIDFEELEKGGLFLICGETGSGKTTILDAMCYALYGRSSGGLRGDMSVMRCKLAGKDDETFVEYIFDSGGNRYCFTRSLKYGRKNLNDSHNCMILKDGAYVPLFENPKLKSVNDTAEKLIGLTYDQFRQVIMLPQGQFEKLLVSNSEEKEKILVSLFHADRWQKIAEELSRRVTERDKALQQERERITDKLRAYGCDTIDGLSALLSEKKTALTDLTAKTEAAWQEVSTRRKAKEAAILENRDFAQLLQSEQQLEQLSGRASWAQRESSLLMWAERANALTPQYQEFGTEKRQLTETQQEVAAATARREAAAAQWLKARNARKEHEAARPQQLERQQEMLRLSGSRSLYSTLEDKAKAQQQAAKAAETADRVLKQAESNFTAAHNRWLQALEMQSRTMDTYRQAQETYLRGIGHILAQELKPGLPCPVCGSTHHPAPAQSSGEQTVTKAQLDHMNQAVTQAGETVAQCASQQTAAEAAKAKAQTQAGEAKEKAALTKQDYQTALEQIIPGIPTLSQLETRLRELDQACKAYEQQESSLTAAANTAESNGKAAAAELEHATARLAQRKAAYDRSQAKWLEALAVSGLETEQRYLAAVLLPEEYQSRKTQLLRYNANMEQLRQSVQEQRARLVGRTAPDLAGITKALAVAEENHQSLSNALVLSKSHVTQMEQDLAQLTGRLTIYNQARIKTDADMDFANRLRGRSGISLQRYVLGVMLTSITIQANALLKNVYGGRYQLYRTDEIAGASRKGGLELEVLDRANAERRSVTTLSGGEKFLVALSLAIGLSTVVQAQGGGIRLEAMFIDEGFGSLDGDSISDALDVLQGIGKNCGVVGIISHVGQLEEAIPTKLQVKKGAKGSTCRISR